MNNKALLVVIALILVAILGVLVVNHNNRPKTVGENVSEVVEEIGDEIDDNTTAR